jgi:hypothetical protein
MQHYGGALISWYAEGGLVTVRLLSSVVRMIIMYLFSRRGDQIVLMGLIRRMNRAVAAERPEMRHNVSHDQPAQLTRASRAASIFVGLQLPERDDRAQLGDIGQCDCRATS